MKRIPKTRSTQVVVHAEESRVLLTKRTPTFTVVAALVLFASVFGGMYYFDMLPEGYFHLYSDEVKFFDTYVINEPHESGIALGGTFFLTYCNVYVRRKLSAWQINYLNSPHVPRDELDGRYTIQITLTMFTIFLSLSSAVNIFFMFSNFWFLVAQTLATIVVSVRMTSRFLTEKRATRLVPKEAFTDSDMVISV
ncbi:hypothetical protein CYMTET_41743 [Cymbomonas tetramitiformis]|uniref:Uncharacterized protein n=1 Tax=Cymbomonas tetramitiformis TaxID=36881 RepID=A0AAE0C5H9_9CHLO|nr:hypothetical protein CYMTET_54289 [Cymbomonas tetramitiformis]KAK3236087.1 hypothetical protein CYMTET_53756 [Cymbomonas tetramitiformis]KAK3248833.1 hypothetical protein CYMTET_41743 [Cymbomonas tetramitiformis]